MSEPRIRRPRGPSQGGVEADSGTDGPHEPQFTGRRPRGEEPQSTLYRAAMPSITSSSPSAKCRS